MTTAEQNYIFSLEEPDLILQGNGKRHQPITHGWMEKNKVMDAMRERIGAEAWEANMAFDKLTIAEKDKINEEHLKRMGL
jgi:hypothetical protein